MKRLVKEGIVAAEAMFACLRPALEIFSSYDTVETLGGKEVELKEYLKHVWARKIAHGLGVHLEELGRLGGIVETKGKVASLLFVTERRDTLFRKGKDSETRNSLSYFEAGRRWRASLVALADHILGLHRDVHEVLILEERAGEYVVVDEASRKGVTLLADNMSIVSKQRLLSPTVILGTAGQFVGQPSKLVGIEYEEAGLVLAPLNENRLLALSTRKESLGDVWQTISAALPQLKERVRETPATVGAVASTSEAESRARHFLAGRFPNESSRIMIDEVTYRRFDEQWEVYGSFRSQVLSLPRHFQVEVDANDGSVKRFAFFSTSSILVLAATACLVAASLLALMLFAGLWKL